MKKINLKFNKDNILPITLIGVLVFIFIMVIFTGVTYAYWQKNYAQKEANKIKSGCFSFELTDENPINLTNTYPMSETDAMKNTPYTFTITNNCSIDMYYNVTLNTTGSSDLDNYLNYKLVDEKGNTVGPKIIGSTKKYDEYNNSTYTDKDNNTYDILNSYILTTGSLKAAIMNSDNSAVVTKGQSKTYKLYVWMDESVEDLSTMGKSFTGKVIVTSSTSSDVKAEYKEALLNGTDPVLSDNLIPVTLADDGTVTKADTYSEWYKYEEKKWANAVILSDNTQTYNNGDTIPEDNIESYFVWIPKYSYQIFNLGTTDGYTSSKPTTSNAKEIQIKFGTTNTSDSNNGECTTPMTSGASGNCKVGDYMTSPAFISMNTNGLWVAKFETTGSTTNITVKPNQTSLRSLSVKTMFETAYNYKRDNDSHMMKNTEWGAVAYLSHSKYGINTEVRINNNSNYITGYAAVDGTDQTQYPGTYGTSSDLTLPYNTTTGYKASTTGNITGVYDMSGGAWEYMAAYRKDTYGSSGFDATSLANYNNKYYDEYDLTSNNNNYSKRIIGDATGEMGPFYYYQDGDNNNRIHNNWYADHSYFASSSNPWFGRGGVYYNGVLAGQFYFSLSTGGANSYIGLRLVFTK